MNPPRVVAPLEFLLIMSLIICAGCSDEDDPITPPPPGPPSPYVGAAACASCHQPIYSNYMGSGHQEHLQRIENGKPPAYSWEDSIEYPVPGPPNGLAWSDVSLVIGGTTRVTVFVGKDGNLITGPEARWDRFSGEWIEYYANQTMSFDCGRCHATGYDPDGEERGFAGLSGTWEVDGVTCEACHGPGRVHTESEAIEDITIDRTTEFCVGCHHMFKDHPYPQTGNEIRELKHFDVDCVTCHDPHVSARFDPDEAIRLGCPDCHSATAPGVPRQWPVHGPRR